MQLDWSKNKPANTLQWHYSTHIFKPLWLTFLSRASLLKLGGMGGLDKGVKQSRSSPAQAQDRPVVSLQPPLWPGVNDEDEPGAQLAGVSFNFAHLTASNSPLAHKIYPNWFQWACGRGGQVWRESGKENRGMDVQTWDTQCQVLSCPPSLISSGRCSQTTAQTSSSTSQLLPNTGSKEKSTQHKFLSTELEQTSSFGSTLKWQQVQLTQPCHQPTAESWQIPAQASASVAAHMWYWYFFWSCAKDMKVNSISRGVFAQCNLLIFCPFWLYKIQVTHFSIKQYMSYPNWISSVCLHFQIVYSSSNSVFL